MRRRSSRGKLSQGVQKKGDTGRGQGGVAGDAHPLVEVEGHVPGAQVPVPLAGRAVGQGAVLDPDQGFGVAGEKLRLAAQVLLVEHEDTVLELGLAAARVERPAAAAEQEARLAQYDVALDLAGLADPVVVGPVAGEVPVALGDLHAALQADPAAAQLRARGGGFDVGPLRVSAPGKPRLRVEVAPAAEAAAEVPQRRRHLRQGHPVQLRPAFDRFDRFDRQPLVGAVIAGPAARPVAILPPARRGHREQQGGSRRAQERVDRWGRDHGMSGTGL